MKAIVIVLVSAFVIATVDFLMDVDFTKHFGFGKGLVHNALWSLFGFAYCFFRHKNKD